MKWQLLKRYNDCLCVAPRVGVWIEIFDLRLLSPKSAVAPRVGVWIEINRLLSLRLLCIVAPRVGVWIEMTWILKSSYKCQGRSSRRSVD